MCACRGIGSLRGGGMSHSPSSRLRKWCDHGTAIMFSFRAVMFDASRPYVFISLGCCWPSRHEYLQNEGERN